MNNLKFLFKPVIIILVLVLALWLIGFLNKERPPMPSSSFRLSPDVSKAKIGEEFKIDLILKTDQEINGADVVLSYDRKTLEAIDIVPGSIFPLYPRKKIDPEKGRVEITGVKSKKDGQLFTQPSIFATIVFKGKKTGAGKVNFIFSEGKTTGTTIIKTEGSQNILEKVYNGEYEIK